MELSLEREWEMRVEARRVVGLIHRACGHQSMVDWLRHQFYRWCEAHGVIHSVAKAALNDMGGAM